jgi:hypothetical protein
VAAAAATNSWLHTGCASSIACPGSLAGLAWPVRMPHATCCGVSAPCYCIPQLRVNLPATEMLCHPGRLLLLGPAVLGSMQQQAQRLHGRHGNIHLRQAIVVTTAIFLSIALSVSLR